MDRRYGTFVVYLRKCVISEIAQIVRRRKANEIEDSIRTLMELLYEACTSYPQSLDQGTIFIDPVKIPVNFHPLLLPLALHAFYFSQKKLRMFLQHDA